MNKIVLSVMVSAMLFAGGELVADIEPIEYITVTEEPQASPFYLGVGYIVDEEVDYYGTYNYSGLTVMAGAVVAREGTMGLAIEGRVSGSFDDYGVSSYGIYAKPEIELGKDFTTFLVVGYQRLSTYEMDINALGIGVGGAFFFTDSLGVQADWIYSSTEKDEFDFQPEYSSLTASILYRF